MSLRRGQSNEHMPPLSCQACWVGRVHSAVSVVVWDSNVFSKEGTTPLDVKLYVRSLKETPGLETVLIGSRSLFQMTSAVLADMNGARSIVKALHFIDEVVLVSPRLALLQTSTPSATWAQFITSQKEQDPEDAIEKLRFRKSQNGG